jgi:hypothetical protein
MAIYFDETLERVLERAFRRVLDQMVQAKVEECFKKYLSERVQAKVEECFKEISSQEAGLPNLLDRYIERWFHNNLE